MHDWRIVHLRIGQVEYVDNMMFLHNDISHDEQRQQNYHGQETSTDNDKALKPRCWHSFRQDSFGNCPHDSTTKHRDGENDQHRVNQVEIHCIAVV